MTDILPKPSDIEPTHGSGNTQPSTPRNRQSLSLLAGLIVIGFLCLIVAFIYDYKHNKDQDNTRKQDLSYISSVLAGYHELYHYYPTLNQINSSAFGAFAPSLERTKFKDPSANSEKLSATPSDSSYAYEVLPANCNNTTQDCNSYKLVAILTNNKDYVVTSPKPKS